MSQDEIKSYYLYSWYHDDKKVMDSICENYSLEYTMEDPLTPKHKPGYIFNLTFSQIMKLTEDYDLKITKGKNSIPIITLDEVGGNFRQR